jgi:hypothetical protein
MGTILRLSVLLFLLVTHANGQRLDSLPEERRDRVILDVAKAAVMQYGPGYYRDHVPPTIQRGVVTKDTEAARSMDVTKSNIGRAFFMVIYPADKTKEICRGDIAARVGIWADTRKVYLIYFDRG